MYGAFGIACLSFAPMWLMFQDPEFDIFRLRALLERNYEQLQPLSCTITGAGDGPFATFTAKCASEGPRCRLVFSYPEGRTMEWVLLPDRTCRWQSLRPGQRDGIILTARSIIPGEPLLLANFKFIVSDQRPALNLIEAIDVDPERTQIRLSANHIELDFSKCRGFEWIIRVRLSRAHNLAPDLLEAERANFRERREVVRFDEVALGVYFPSEVHGFSKGKHKNTWHFSDVRVGEPLPESAFAFSPPPGTRVSDFFREEVFLVNDQGGMIPTGDKVKSADSLGLRTSSPVEPTDWGFWLWLSAAVVGALVLVAGLWLRRRSAGESAP